MDKAPEAFRTITEVSEWLNTPSHVLRFWESRFPELDPVQRAGGRRYYRPADMQLLGGIKRLLHVEGNTIKAVQSMIGEQGVDAICALSPALDQPFEDQVDMPEADIAAELATIEIPSTAPDQDPVAPQEPILKPQPTEPSKDPLEAAETETSQGPEDAPDATKDQAPKQAPSLPEQSADIPLSLWIGRSPQYVRAIDGYSPEDLTQIEEHFYALKVVRNRMRRAIRA